MREAHIYNTLNTTPVYKNKLFINAPSVIVNHFTSIVLNDYQD